MNSSEGKDTYSCRIAATVNEIKAMRDSWEELRSRSDRCLQTDIDYYLGEVEAISGACPHVIVLYRNGSPLSGLVGIIKEALFELKLGYKVLFKPKVRLLEFNHPMTIGDDSREVLRKFLPILKESLIKFHLDVILFKNAKIDSPIYEVVSTCIHSFIRSRVLPVTKRWRLLFPESFEVYYSTRSKHIKRNIKQGIARLNRDYRDVVQYKCFSKKPELDAAMAQVEAVAERAWQRKMGVGFRYDNRHRARYRSSIAFGWLRVYVITVQDEPVAFWIGFRYGNRMTVEYTGYDPDFGYYSVGAVLLMNLIEDLFSDTGIKVIDFGPGPDAYKGLYGNESWNETSVCLFAHSPKGLALHAGWVTLGLTTHVGKSLLGTLKIEKKVREIWLKRRKGINPS